jgi:RNA polymerase sigma-70 factor (ECF subfamily)
MPDADFGMAGTASSTAPADAWSLMQAHRGLLTKLVRLYCPRTDEADDAWQEIYVQVHHALPGYRGDAQASTWLYRVALNTLLTMQRKAYRRPSTAPAEAALEPGHEPEHRQDAAERLHRAMVRLPEADRALIALHLEGFRAEEIGETMGISANHVNVKVHRIKKQLQQWLKNP